MSRISSIAGDQGEKVQKIVELHSVIAGANAGPERTAVHGPFARVAAGTGRGTRGR